MPDEALNAPLPALLSVSGVKSRLEAIFPETFPNRTTLVGQMAARTLFVFLYGGFIHGTGRHLRPSFVVRFTDAQAAKTSDDERREWLRSALRARPPGTPWYADNTREPIRDDLMRSELLERGFAHKLPGVPTTASTPVWSLDPAFVALFDPALVGTQLEQTIEHFRVTALDPATLQRMALRSVHAQKGDVYIDMPDGQRIRISAGPSALIAKGLIEDFATRRMRNPAVLWLSASDKKAYPAFVELAARVGLSFDLNAELPDVVLADLGEPARFLLCEIVATDGPVSEGRKRALLELIRGSNIPEQNVDFLTAYEDREAGPFRKNFSRLARNSLVWFRTEPDILVRIEGDEPA